MLAAGISLNPTSLTPIKNISLGVEFNVVNGTLMIMKKNNIYNMIPIRHVNGFNNITIDFIFHFGHFKIFDLSNWYFLFTWGIDSL